MFKIFCQDDLDRFKANNLYPTALGDYLQARFLELKKCMGEYIDCESEDDFNLREIGPLVVLTANDNFRDLSEIGFNACENGIFGDIPEEVSVIETPGEFSFIEIQTAFNNEYLLYLYVLKSEERAYPEFQGYLKRWLHASKKFCPGV